MQTLQKKFQKFYFVRIWLLRCSVRWWQILNTQLNFQDMFYPPSSCDLSAEKVQKMKMRGTVKYILWSLLNDVYFVKCPVEPNWVTALSEQHLCVPMQSKCEVWGWGSVPAVGQCKNKGAHFVLNVRRLTKMHKSLNYIYKLFSEFKPQLLMLSAEIHHRAYAEWTSNDVIYLPLHQSCPSIYRSTTAVSPASAPDQGYSDTLYWDSLGTLSSKLTLIIFACAVWFSMLRCFCWIYLRRP